MLKFKEMKASSSNFRECNDCFVIALAIVSGKSYAEAHAIAKRHGRKDRDGTFLVSMIAAVKSVNPSASHEKVRKPCGGQYTSRTIGKAFPNGNHIVLFKGHAAAMVNGIIEDWSNGRCMRVKSIISL